MHLTGPVGAYEDENFGEGYKTGGAGACGVDLAAALLRQQGLMREALLVLKPRLLCDAQVAAAVRGYVRFLGLMERSSGTPLVPSTETDLIWHTQMLLLAKYAAGCARFVGHEVDQLKGEKQSGVNLIFVLGAHAPWQRQSGF